MKIFLGVLLILVGTVAARLKAGRQAVVHVDTNPATPGANKRETSGASWGPKVDLWVFRHMHFAFDERINGLEW